MQKRSKKRAKRVRNLIVICTITAIILSVSTYAWFIGMRTVNVSSFDVEIAATDSLLLSLNGKDWDTTVDISEGTLDTASYANHTNSWGGSGLFPVSSIGDMDTTASRMKLFEKASLTTTPGGYRLLASRVHNYEQGNPEQSGYVVFDLFVKNFSGTQYIKKLEPLDEEAIYLTTNSAVTVAADGVANTGIENSVRVAFAQIGRVSGTTTNDSTITGITCTSVTDGDGNITGDVTGICRTAQIWEPNDKNHVANAISWYNTSCLARIAAPIHDKDSFTGNCGAVANGNTYHTYAVAKDITSANQVDIYDGADYNGYTASVTAGYLNAYPFFTDTMKNLTSTNRPTFMTLAPNSITKIRIYIYIEGQDVDNYDFASIGKKISVNFGFTKERYTANDIHYNGPDLHPSTDVTKPVITLNGQAAVTVAKDAVYTDAGATAEDEVDGDITKKILVVNPVNTHVAGVYTVTYMVSDEAGNYALTVTRKVTVE